MAVVVDNFKSGVSQRLGLSDMDGATLARWIELPGAADEWAKRRYGEARHLPGKHNQKLHGKGGGHGEYVPGQWAELKGEEAHAAAFTAMRSNVERVRDLKPAGANPELLEALEDPEMVDMLARYEVSQALGPNAWVLRNGSHIVAGNGGTARRGIADQVDELQRIAPVKGNVTVLLDDKLDGGAYGETSMDHGGIRLNSGLVSGQTVHGESEGWFMPSAKGTSSEKYVLTHEWGHRVAAEKLNSGQVKESELSLYSYKHGFDFAHTSAYGRTEPHELFAETFAEWAMTGGKSDNPVVRDYAERFGWGS